MRICHERFLVVAVLAVASFALLAEHHPYERYQSIVDRQMFGEPPPGFDPTMPPGEVQKNTGAKTEAELTKEQEQIKSAVHFSVINIAEDGTPMVGFTDNSDAKLPKHYFLRLGETRDGWLVKEADPGEKSMTIVKNDIEVELSLGDNSGSGGGKTARAGQGASAGGPSSLFGSRRVSSFSGSAASDGLRSLRGRRQMLQQQRESERKAMEDERRRLEAERRAAEEKSLMDKAEREAEREEQRKQLLAIQEELKKAREAREQAATATAARQEEGASDGVSE